MPIFLSEVLCTYMFYGKEYMRGLWYKYPWKNKAKTGALMLRCFHLQFTELNRWKLDNIIRKCKYIIIQKTFISIFVNSWIQRRRKTEKLFLISDPYSGQDDYWECKTDSKSRISSLPIALKEYNRILVLCTINHININDDLILMCESFCRNSS